MAENLGDWVNLSWSELEADLSACEHAEGDQVALDADLSDLSRRVSQGADLSTLLDAHRSLQESAKELQQLLVRLELVRFGSASMLAQIGNGVLLPGEGLALPPAAQAAATHPVIFPPQDPDLGSLGDAEDLDDYQVRLAALPDSLFLCHTLRLCAAELNQHQDQKDFGRDSLKVNGVLVSGAKDGYDAAVRILARELQCATAWKGRSAETAAQLVLGALNRTCSGAAALMNVLRIYGSDAALVSPDSRAARPLEAVLLGDALLGQAHTRYCVWTGTGETPLFMMDAAFTFRLPFELLQRLDAAPPGEADEIKAAVLLTRVP